MKKEKIIRGIILGVIFVIALVGFSHLTNRGNADMTADMGLATLPTVSFELGKNQVNTLVGHVREMDMVAVAEGVTVYGEKNSLNMSVTDSETLSKTVVYEVYSADGAECLMKKEGDIENGKVALDFKSALKAGEEALLKIILQTNQKKIYYYTRVMKEKDAETEKCLKFALTLHEQMITKKDTDDVKKVIEPNSQGDNTTLRHVTIHSDLDHVLWGKLKPEMTGEMSMSISETKKAYTGILLSYRVLIENEQGEQDHCLVKEYFKIGRGKERMTLLAYDRSLEEIFNPANEKQSNKGIDLGLVKESTVYRADKKGMQVAFVQANELWVYNKKENEYSQVFSFRDADREDERHYTDRHEITIYSMDKGNLTFAVSGYMNRGEHEGETGIAVYYYNQEQRWVEEEAFLSGTSSPCVVHGEMQDLAYYNAEQGVLYLITEGKLLRVDKKKNTRTVLMDGLEKKGYVTSADGHLLAYQKNKNGKQIAEIWDFASDQTREAEAPAGEIIIPLGFLGDDFVCGISREGQTGADETGAKVTAMHRVEIRNEENRVVKTHEKSGMYVLRTVIAGNMLTLVQGEKSGEGYRSVSEDYITDNEQSGSGEVSLKSYRDEKKETQYRLVFAEGISGKTGKKLRPKQILQERKTAQIFETKKSGTYYYAYGYGEQIGAFAEAGEAISLAKKYSGVVYSPAGNRIWEDGNRVAWYRNFKLNGFAAKAAENTLEACLRRVLAYEGVTEVTREELQNTSPEKVISEKTGKEAVRLTGISAKDVFYLMDKGTPVIALRNPTSAILLIGYDAKTVTYADPATGVVSTVTIEKMDSATEGSGNTYVGYIN